MSGAAGTWDVTTTSVIGETTYVITLVGSGNDWSGSVEGGAGAAEIRDVVITGDRVSLTLRVTKPAPADFDVFAGIDGDLMTGTAKTKFLPEAKLVGRRRGDAAVLAPSAVPEAAPGIPAASPEPAPRIPAASPEPAPRIPAASPEPAAQSAVAPGLIGFGQPVTPDTVALEFELPPPPPPGLVPPPPGR